MNILLVVPWDEKRGGVISVVDNLAQHLRTEGHEVLFFHTGAKLVLTSRTTKLGLPGVQLRLSMPFGSGLRGVLRTALSPVLFTATLLQLIWFLRSRHIQIINLHYPNDNFVYFAICSHLLGIRLVTSVHGGDAFYRGRPKDDYSRAFRFVIESSDLVVLPSDAYRRQLLDAFPAIQGRTIFIHNGIDDTLFSGAQRDRDTAEAGQRYILCIAELKEYKGLDVLLHAARPLLTGDPSLTLALAGDGPLREELENLASSLGIRHQTMFLGPQGAHEIARLLRGCAVMVLPSREEAFGIVLIEAMACKAPVVACKVGGIPEVIEHGQSGLLVEPEDPEALTAGLYRVLTDSALRETISENGYARVMRRFRSSHNGAAYLEAFRSLLDGEETSPHPDPIPAKSPDGDARATN